MPETSIQSFTFSKSAHNEMTLEVALIEVEAYRVFTYEYLSTFYYICIIWSISHCRACTSHTISLRLTREEILTSRHILNYLCCTCRKIESTLNFVNDICSRRRIVEPTAATLYIPVTICTTSFLKLCCPKLLAVDHA